MTSPKKPHLKKQIKNALPSKKNKCGKYMQRNNRKIFNPTSKTSFENVQKAVSHRGINSSCTLSKGKAAKVKPEMYIRNVRQVPETKLGKSSKCLDSENFEYEAVYKSDSEENAEEPGTSSDLTDDPFDDSYGLNSSYKQNKRKESNDTSAIIDYILSTKPKMAQPPNDLRNPVVAFVSVQSKGKVIPKVRVEVDPKFDGKPEGRKDSKDVKRESNIVRFEGKYKTEMDIKTGGFGIKPEIHKSTPTASGNISDASFSSSKRDAKGIPKKDDTDPFVPTYQLSNLKFSKDKWTKLRQPNFRITEKIITFATSPCHPAMKTQGPLGTDQKIHEKRTERQTLLASFEWPGFQKSTGQKKQTCTSHYDNNILAAVFQEEGGSFIYYPNGELAVSLQKSRVGQKLIVYSMTKVNEHGEFFPSKPLAAFDQFGNGVVFSYDGDIRLNYDQAEGAIYDTPSGIPVRWVWKGNEYIKQRRTDLDGVVADPNDDVYPLTESILRKKSKRSLKKAKSMTKRKTKHGAGRNKKTKKKKKKTPGSESGVSDDSVDLQMNLKKKKIMKGKKKKNKDKKKKRNKKAPISKKSKEKVNKTEGEKTVRIQEKTEQKLPLEKTPERGKTLKSEKKSVTKKARKSATRGIKRKRTTKSKRSQRGSYMCRDLPPLRLPPAHPEPTVSLRPIALKITDYVSFRIVEQDHIHVDFHYHPKHFRFHLGVTVHPEELVRIDKVVDPQPTNNIVPCYFELMYKRSESLYNLFTTVQHMRKQAFIKRKIYSMKMARLMGYKYEYMRRRRSLLTMSA